MALTGKIISSISIGGIQFTSSRSRNGEGQISHITVIPAGQAGEISATGIDTLGTGHGIVATDVINVHWTVAGVLKTRRGLLVDTDGANDITFDETPAGEGDALPSEGTAVVASVQVEISTDWDGDDLAIIAAMSTGIGMADFRTSSASLLAVDLFANDAWDWATQTSESNPLTGDPVETIIVSNGSTTESTFRVGLVYDSVP